MEVVETEKVGRRFDGGEEAEEGVARINGELYNWQNSSRIIRVSRASGGKDRHSKVWTSKGLRDRRVRLSVSTAIQFYDLQDRLGYDQPSKAVDWLIKAASNAISDLPMLNASFPVTPTQFRGEQNRSTDMKIDDDVSIRQKLACSSPPENSKGSAGISLCQSTRERMERNDNQKVTHLSISPSFTELLTGGFGRFPGDSAQLDPDDKHSFLLPSSAVEYFSSQAIKASGRSGQICSLPPTMAAPSLTSSNENQAEMQHFADHLIPNVGEDNLNFTVSSIVTSGWGNIPAGFNRGTLQSNSPSVLPHLPKFPSIDGPNLPFFVGPAATSTAPQSHHHHHHQHQFSDSQLQLWCQNSSQTGNGET